MRLPHLLGPAIILLMTVLICPGASAFWPLSWQLGDEHNYLGPLVTVENKGAQTESVTIRPLLFLAEPQKETYQFLYPLGKTTEGNSHFVPFYSANFGKDYRNYNLLLFFYGQNAERRTEAFSPSMEPSSSASGEIRSAFFSGPSMAIRKWREERARISSGPSSLFMAERMEASRPGPSSEREKGVMSG